MTPGARAPERLAAGAGDVTAAARSFEDGGAPRKEGMRIHLQRQPTTSAARGPNASMMKWGRPKPPPEAPRRRGSRHAGSVSRSIPAKAGNAGSVVSCSGSSPLERGTGPGSAGRLACAREEGVQSPPLIGCTVQPRVCGATGTKRQPTDGTNPTGGARPGHAQAPTGANTPAVGVRPARTLTPSRQPHFVPHGACGTPVAQGPRGPHPRRTRDRHDHGAARRLGPDHRSGLGTPRPGAELTPADLEGAAGETEMEHHGRTHAGPVGPETCAPRERSSRTCCMLSPQRGWHEAEIR